MNLGLLCPVLHNIFGWKEHHLTPLTPCLRILLLTQPKCFSLLPTFAKTWTPTYE